MEHLLEASEGVGEAYTNFLPPSSFVSVLWLMVPTTASRTGELGDRTQALRNRWRHNRSHPLAHAGRSFTVGLSRTVKCF